MAPRHAVVGSDLPVRRRGDPGQKELDDDEEIDRRTRPLVERLFECRAMPASERAWHLGELRRLQKEIFENELEFNRAYFH
jgi:hypothetical protein